MNKTAGNFKKNGHFSIVFENSLLMKTSKSRIYICRLTKQKNLDICIKKVDFLDILQSLNTTLMDSLNKLNTSNNLFDYLTKKPKIKMIKLTPLKESKNCQCSTQIHIH